MDDFPAPARTTRGASAQHPRLGIPVRITEQAWPEGTIPVVSIVCATYNHEKFIRECLDGFLMQETSFPVELLIHDDASTDGTADIVREYEKTYPHLIKPIYQTVNQYSNGVKPNSTFNWPRAQGEFLAFCEGDDYWILPNKLQLQVGFLETHLDYSLCWTRFFTQDDSTGKRSIDKNGQYFRGGEGTEFDFELFDRGWHIGMQTLVLRRTALSSANIKNKHYRDVFLIADLLTVGRGHCLSIPTAVYRQHPGGIYSGVSAIERAAKGAVIYREIFLTYPQNSHLRAKYQKFSGYFIRELLGNARYKDAFQAIDGLTASVPDSDAHRKHLYELVEKLLSAKDRRFREVETRLTCRLERLGRHAVAVVLRGGKHLVRLSWGLVRRRFRTGGA